MGGGLEGDVRGTGHKSEQVDISHAETVDGVMGDPLCGWGHGGSPVWMGSWDDPQGRIRQIKVGLRTTKVFNYGNLSRVLWAVYVTCKHVHLLRAC